MAPAAPVCLYPRCVHRGASLYYGRVEDDGIRCCYHGWKFAVDGQCIDQPCEPDNGAATCRLVRQPYYPVKELYGLIFAYMGPPEQAADFAALRRPGKYGARRIHRGGR